MASGDPGLKAPIGRGSFGSMPGFTFLHASDLHLGKRFGFLPEEARAAAVQARAEILPRLAQEARDAGAAHLLLAGDTFDTETPSPATLRQALGVMAEDPALTWWVLPGNHDSLAAEALWEGAAGQAAPNVRLLTRAEPVEMAHETFLLPATLPRRFPGRDLTQWMDDAVTPEGALRIGLGHGSMVDFGEETSAETIAPDRAVRAGLTYLALGDWHATRAIGPRTWYSGTPEPDSFRHGLPGRCLIVSLAGAQAPPAVQEIETGRYSWRAPALSLTPQEDPEASLLAVLPEAPALRRRTLVRLRPEGRVPMAARAELERVLAEIAPDFLHFEAELTRLSAEVVPEDLDAIAAGGALRAAADALLRDTGDTAQDARTREIAGAALTRLYGLVRDAAP